MRTCTSRTNGDQVALTGLPGNVVEKSVQAGVAPTAESIATSTLLSTNGPVVSDDMRLKAAVETAVRLALAREELLTLQQVQEILHEKRLRVLKLRKLKHDPLPTFPLHGRPRTKRGELYDWIARQKKNANNKE